MTSVWQQALAELTRRYGRAAQPRGETRLERAIVIVARARSDAAAAKLLQTLRDADVLSIDALASLSPDELSTIMPEGLAAATSRRLVDFARFVARDYQGELELLSKSTLDQLRGELRNINGLGPETIATLLLVVSNFSVMPITAALHRVTKRHGWIDLEADSESIAAEFGTAVFESAEEYWQFHELVEQVGKEFCGRRALCEKCPLVSLLPEGGARERGEWD